MSFNSLPNDKFLDPTKFRAFADDNSNVTKMVIFLFDRVENIVGKGENAVLQYFLLFQQCFQKAFSRFVKLCGEGLKARGCLTNKVRNEERNE